METTDCCLAFNISYADFSRTIIEQINNAYDLLILDWTLDAPSAKGIVDTMRQRAPNTQILALTDNTPTVDPIDRGADEFLVEPVSDRTLSDTIEWLAFQKEYEQLMDEFFRLATERALLQTELESDINVTNQYLTVVQEMMKCRERIATIQSALPDDEFDRVLRQLLDD
ncbi:response regulator receiver protein [Halosolutus gelatinilyticus]|uniref:response regulator receiver protein n=1 Tax=Halosolutus gelatinilyticus TaxID=2931975 RepID=UPI001FF2D988|nr:response regulator receiver protein [Halosolutus gelatinilyticus]